MRGGVVEGIGWGGWDGSVRGPPIGSPDGEAHGEEGEKEEDGDHEARIRVAGGDPGNSAPVKRVISQPPPPYILDTDPLSCHFVKQLELI